MRKKYLTYTRETVEVLYDHMSTEARDSIASELVGRVGIALLLEVSSIERLLEIVGRESDPRKCAPETIRARFGVHSAPTHIGSRSEHSPHEGELWWQNAFHRPIDEREAIRDLVYVFEIRRDLL